MAVAAVATSGMVLLGACGGEGGDQGEGGTDEPPSASPPDLTGRLMFSRFDEATHTFLSTHVANPDGSGETELPLPGPEGGGRWSRSGEEIAVMTVLEDERIGTAVITPDGEVARVLDIPDPTLNLVCTVWSPDDTRLACEGWDDSDPTRTGIYTVRADDGGGLVRLTTPPDGMVDFPGDYSPDGSTFVFKRTTEEDPGPLLTVPVAGGQPQPLADDDLAVEDPGRFSPDGSRILTSSGGAILVLAGDGEEVTRFSRDDHFLFGAVWSPDGDHIAYSDAIGGPFADVYVAAPDGSGAVQVTDTPDNEIRVEWGADPS